VGLRRLFYGWKTVIESSEDKLVRILTRVPFEIIDEKIQSILSNPRISILTTAEAYRNAGWKRGEYHTEVKRRAANRR